MTGPSAKGPSASTSRFHPYSTAPNDPSISRMAAPQATPQDSNPTLNYKKYAKPFDRFKPLGGGADGDIFRCFKVPRMEEELFIIHWVRQPLSFGFLARDETGTLVFRVSSSDVSRLSMFGIGNPGSQAEWSHVYDPQGISWLTRWHGSSFRIFQTDWDEKVRLDNGIVRRYGPSRLSPEELMAMGNGPTAEDSITDSYISELRSMWGPSNLTQAEFHALRVAEETSSGDRAIRIYGDTGLSSADFYAPGQPMKEDGRDGGHGVE
ncbi:hypothetical protein K504DRAFT_505540 [Pleomassaria siparia CBS 279.74]|uniref:Uncharacterized protein n=1 Tax=Pleomassaria siparia CBS 279.74 TaxID=1314801 RepID=A0A6G1JZV7_9PLEO|nr:hypothetical protein K504DRAFT_505540 [Pleomassaria siparia CBS 279.74]